MFINCPYCKALVATDPATDLPPEQCPRCAAKLRSMPAADASATPPASQAADHRDDAVEPGLLAHLLEVPADIAPAATDDGLASPPSELSSQIHRIVTGEAPATASPPPVSDIAPIATLLKPADAEAAPSPILPRPEAEPGTGPGPTPNANPATAPAQPPQGIPPAPGLNDGPNATAAVETAPDATIEAAIETEATTQHDDDSAQATPEDQPAMAAAAAPAVKALPSFARDGTALRRSGFHWRISSAIAALALLLLLQLLLADRAQLAADARWRPLVSTLCQVFGCSLPPWREPTAFAVLARDVRPHPSTPGTLRVTATFRNDARWPQPWPRLRLTLSDVNGNAVATRDFGARDYLGAVPTSTELASGQSAAIAMDIVEPQPRSVAFDFQLH